MAFMNEITIFEQKNMKKKGTLMSRKIKKLFSLILVLALTAGLFPTLTLTTGAENGIAYAVTGGNIYFDPDAGTIISCDDTVTEAVIPDTINDIKVLEIGDWAFENCKQLTAVTLPQAITYIGDCAFKGCEALKEFTVPARTRYVGMLAFEGCTSLEAISVAKANTVFSSVEGVLLSRDKSRVILCPEGKEGAFTFPQWVKTIEPFAFYNCKKLNRIYFNESLQEIGEYAFQGCSSIQRVTLHEGLTVIGGGAFNDCTDLRTIALPESLTEIKEFAFMGCISLKEITVPEGVTSIGQTAFSGCSSLTKAVLPQTLTVIQNSTFSGCSSLTELIIPSAVTTIEDFAFSDCAALERLSLPEGLTQIGNYAFTRCDSLTEMNVDENNTVFSSAEGILYSKDKTILLLCPAGQFGSVKIPDGVTTIANDSFCDCADLFSVTIPVSVTEIGDWAFANCENLTEVCYTGTPEQWEQIKIGEYNDFLLQAKRLEAYALEGGNLYFDPAEGAVVHCDKTVTNAVIPDQIRGIAVKKIEMFAFEGCDMLTSVTIPESVTEIESNPFSTLETLTEIHVAANNPSYVSENDVLYTKNQEILIFCPRTKTGIFTVPDGVKEIGESAFSGCALLTGIQLPDSLQIIRSSAFSFCTSLENMNLPQNLTGIEIFSFLGCSALKSITIPASLTFMENAFGQCTALQEINVEMENQNFSSADGILYNKEQTVLILCPADGPQKVTLPKTVTEINPLAFRGCTKLSEMKLPDSLTVIGMAAFSGCTALKEINLPDTVEEIEMNTFSGCTSLETVALPANLKNIGYSAFKDCISLLTVNYPGSEEEWATIEISPENDMLTVAEITYNFIKSVLGDVNGDNEVNAADGTLMNRYLAKWTVNIDEKAADINGDGEVNSADGALLSRHLAKWDISYFQ